MATTDLEHKVATVDEAKVRKDVENCLYVLADYLGVRAELDSFRQKKELKIFIGESSLDKELDNEATMGPLQHCLCDAMKRATNGTGYNSQDGSLTIRKENIADCEAYFEEVAHIIRRALVDKTEGSTDASPVDEFFGRLGRSLGRKLTRGTELEYLFENKPEQKYSDRENMAKIFTANDDCEIYARVNASLHPEIIQRAHSHSRLRAVIAEHYVNKEFNMQTYNHFVQKCDSDLWHEVCDKISAFGMQNKDMRCSPSLEIYFAHVMPNLSEYLSAIDKYVADTIGDAAEKNGEHINSELNRGCSGLAYIFESAQHQMLGACIKLIASLPAHLSGYVAAEHYLEKHPQLLQDLQKSRKTFRGLFERPSAEIDTRFLSPRSGLRGYLDRATGSVRDFLRNRKYEFPTSAPARQDITA